MKVLITGAAGFTGRYMTRCLAEADYEVFGLAQHALELPDVSQLFSCDLMDVERLASIINSIQPDIVIHLAAISFVAHGKADEIYRTNIVGTRNLLNALAEHGLNCKKVLLASSANVYGNRRAGQLTEDTPPAPTNDYAVSKLSMEYVAKLYSNKLPIVIARPFNYTGVGQSNNFLIPKIIKHIKDRATEIELGNLEVSRDFSDVRTVVQYYRRMIESTATTGKTYNVCSGHAYSLSSVLEMVRTISSRDFEVKVNPAFVRSDEVKTLCGDPTNLIADVGKVQEYSLEQTLHWMLAD